MVNVARELMFEVNDDDAEQLKTDLESAFESETSMLWVGDRDGRNVGLAVDRWLTLNLGRQATGESDSRQTEQLGYVFRVHKTSDPLLYR